VGKKAEFALCIVRELGIDLMARQSHRSAAPDAPTPTADLIHNTADTAHTTGSNPTKRLNGVRPGGAPINAVEP
jgi:hypothetical protein